jgi:hypothetical protein
MNGLDVPGPVPIRDPSDASPKLILLQLGCRTISNCVATPCFRLNCPDETVTVWPEMLAEKRIECPTESLPSKNSASNVAEPFVVVLTAVVTPGTNLAA